MMNCSHHRIHVSFEEVAGSVLEAMEKGVFTGTSEASPHIPGKEYCVHNPQGGCCDY